METFVRRIRIERPAVEVFRWHTRPGAFERLNPPWEPVAIVARNGGVTNGALVVLRMRFGPLSQYWVAEHRDYEEGRQFRDVQVSGPFAHWVHTHRVAPDGPSACYLEDHIEYALPLGTLGHLGGGAVVRRKLERMFTYRHRVLCDDLAAHARHQGAPMNILLSGASGFVGTALSAFLTTGGHTVARLVRGQPRPDTQDIMWDPRHGISDLARLEGFDAVIHLAGENIFGRWTAEKRARIRDSRVSGTTTLCEALARLASPPKVLVSASAIGYYGHRADEVLTEESPVGPGFLAEVCQAWEAATVAAQARMRVVQARIGIVLSPSGGALGQMLIPFRLGLGGVIGSGEQYMSWVTLDDVLGAIHHALITEAVRGPMNVTAPQPVTNREFTTILGRVLKRPTVLPLPARVLRLALGDMAEELLLSSARVQPRQLEHTHYPFRQPDLDGALRQVLGKL
ncbi:MAG: TIGR01777 family protein [Deltaproteobacteria bacterium]|nr:TIGR01777 family protein [Deltaproteobacteria bacterium]